MRITILTLVFIALMSCSKDDEIKTIVIKDCSGLEFYEAFVNPGDGSLVYLDLEQIKTHQDIELLGDVVSVTFVKLDRTERTWIGEVEPNDTIIIYRIRAINLHKYKN